MVGVAPPCNINKVSLVPPCNINKVNIPFRTLYEVPCIFCIFFIVNAKKKYFQKFSNKLSFSLTKTIYNSQLSKYEKGSRF